MAKSKNIYSDFNLNQVGDVDKLISLIKAKGNFCLDDYNKFIGDARKSSQPTRLLKRLKTRILPLVSTPINKGDKSTINNAESSNIKEFWEKDYKASDFKLENGKITIGNYFLRSVRVKKTNPSCLTDIDHVFHIAPEYRNNNRNEFHFVPYTDLSLLLAEIQKYVDEQKRQQTLENLDENWKRLLHYYLFMRNRRYIGHVSINFNNWFVDRKAFANLCCVEEPALDEFSSFQMDCPQNQLIEVPFSDLEIYDGEIFVNLERIDFSTRFNKRCESCLYKGKEDYMSAPSWDEFKNLLEEKYGKVIMNDVSKSLKVKFHNDVEIIKDAIRSSGKITFKTYISKNNFNSIFKDEKFSMYLSNKLEPKWAIGDFLRCNKYNRLVLTSEEYIFSQPSIKKICTIIDHNWDIVEKHAEWFLSDILNAKNKKSTITQRNHLRLVTEYYEPRNSIPQKYSDTYSCKEDIITYFYEDVSHYSDDYWDKFPEAFKTYMIWSKEKNASTITLIPTNTRYARYVFHISTSVCSLEEASYVIWRFFTSNIKNKRQRFRIYDYFKIFGICSVGKYCNYPYWS